MASKRHRYSRKRTQGRKERHVTGTPDQDRPTTAPLPAETDKSNAGAKPAAHDRTERPAHE